MSGDFQDSIMVSLNSRSRDSFQLDLFGSVIETVRWIFIGVKSLLELKSEYPKLDFDDSWSFELPYCAWYPEQVKRRRFDYA